MVLASELSCERERNKKRIFDVGSVSFLNYFPEPCKIERVVSTVSISGDHCTDKNTYCIDMPSPIEIVVHT